MNKMTKFFFGLAIMLLSVIAISEKSFAYTEYINPDTGYYVCIDDTAELISYDELSNIVEAMKPITEYGHVCFHTTWDSSYDTASYADWYYHTYFGTASGTVFMIDMNNRQLYIFSDGYISGHITTNNANTITDNVYKIASDENYALCAQTAFEQIGSVLRGERIARPMKYICNALLAAAVAIILNYFYMVLTCEASAIKDIDLASSVSGKLERGKISKKLLKVTKVASSSSGGSGGGGGGGGGSGCGGGHGF